MGSTNSMERRQRVSSDNIMNRSRVIVNNEVPIVHTDFSEEQNQQRTYSCQATLGSFIPRDQQDNVVSVCQKCNDLILKFIAYISKLLSEENMQDQVLNLRLKGYSQQMKDIQCFIPLYNEIINKIYNFLTKVGQNTKKDSYTKELQQEIKKLKLEKQDQTKLYVVKVVELTQDLQIQKAMLKAQKKNVTKRLQQLKSFYDESLKQIKKLSGNQWKQLEEIKKKSKQFLQIYINQWKSFEKLSDQQWKKFMKLCNQQYKNELEQQFTVLFRKQKNELVKIHEKQLENIREIQKERLKKIQEQVKTRYEHKLKESEEKYNMEVERLRVNLKKSQEQIIKYQNKEQKLNTTHHLQFESFQRLKIKELETKIQKLQKSLKHKEDYTTKLEKLILNKNGQKSVKINEINGQKYSIELFLSETIINDK